MRKPDTTEVLTLFFRDPISGEILMETDAAGSTKAEYLLGSTGDPLAKKEGGS